MSSFLNRLKNLKTGSLNFNNNEGDTSSITSFDEEGFLCPICHRKFVDTAGLEHHYLQAHAQSESTATTYPDMNGNKKHEEIEDPLQEASIWKQQFFVSEESRMQLSTDLMQQRQRVGDLEEELELLQKQLRTTQAKVIEQSQEIGNLKATKDVYDAQLAMFTNELLNTQGELKEKQNQVDTLCNDLIPRPTTDDVDVLKRELISVQQRMNDMSLEKEQQIEPLRQILYEIYKYTNQLDQFENFFNQNILIYNEILINTQIDIDINQIKELIHKQKEKLNKNLKSMRNCLNENQIEIEKLKQINNQLNFDLEQRNQLNEQLTNDLEIERKQINLYQNNINELENNIEEIKQEKNQLLLNKMDEDQDNERFNLVRQLTQDKDQYEQQIKELRKQIKQITEDKNNIQQEFENLSIKFTQINNEKNQSDNEINLLKQQLDDINKEKEKQFNEMSSVREEYLNINSKLEHDLQQLEENHKQEIERIENESKNIQTQLEKENFELKQSINHQEELLNQTKSQLETLETEKLNIENQLQISQESINELQTTNSQLNIELDKKNNSINRLSIGIRHSINLAHKTYEYIQEKISISQTNLLTILEESEKDLQTFRIQTLEEIHKEFTNYLTVIHNIIIHNKDKLEKQIEEDNLKFHIEKEKIEKQINQIQNEHEELIKKSNEEKQKLEIQLGEINQNLLQVSESLSESNQTLNHQREKYEKQIILLEDELAKTRSDLESQIKKSDMQLSALTENLSTVRSEIKIANEKLQDFEEIKNEKINLETKLINIQDEKEILLERSLTSENRNEKLLLENGQLAKKVSDLEFALQEIAKEYQGLQIQTNKANERRWLDDTNIHECMKCNQIFTLTQRKHHCRSCGNIFCDTCSSKTAIIAASSKKPQRVCDQCFKELTS